MSPQRAPVPCLTCHRPTRHGSYCEAHCRGSRRCREHLYRRSSSEANRPPDPAYFEPEYRRLRARLLDAWRREHGDVCPGAPDLGHAPHPATDLTLDHLVPLSAGGTHDEANLRVLCRRANAGRSRGGRGAVAKPRRPPTPGC
jgi:5-methylcytosine-specific restriction protein A